MFKLIIIFAFAFTLSLNLSAKEFQLELYDIKIPCSQCNAGKHNKGVHLSENPLSDKIKDKNLFLKGKTKNNVFEKFRPLLTFSNCLARNKALTDTGAIFGKTTRFFVKENEDKSLDVEITISEIYPEVNVEEHLFSPDEYKVKVISKNPSYKCRVSPNNALLIEDIREHDVINSVPFWGEIPFLGKLFQTKSKTRSKTQYLLKISPVE